MTSVRLFLPDSLPHAMVDAVMRPNPFFTLIEPIWAKEKIIMDEDKQALLDHALKKFHETVGEGCDAGINPDLGVIVARQVDILAYQELNGMADPARGYGPVACYGVPIMTLEGMKKMQGQIRQAEAEPRVQSFLTIQFRPPYFLEGRALTIPTGDASQAAEELRRIAAELEDMAAERS